MDKLLIKKVIRYVIAVLCDDCNRFMFRNNREYHFVEDASQATKFTSRETAEYYISCYKIETDDVSVEMVVIPMEISYSLINESEETE